VVNFDLPALYESLDKKRTAEGLNWEHVARAVAGRATGGGHRMSAATLRRTARGGPMEADGILAMLRWLGLSLGNFTRDGPKPASVPLKNLHGFRRFDSRAFFAALDKRRQSQRMTWKELALQLRGFSPGMLKNLGGRRRMSAQQVVELSAWLGAPAEDFTYVARY
jgi:uncharacterized protein YfiM (DUF2279 family)